MTPPRRPPRLRPGDTVAVVAPSGPVDPARLAAGCATLRDLGLHVVVGEHVRARVTLAETEPVPPGWQALAGTDADRAADLRDAWCDPAVRAVLCARGGYGSTRVLDHLDWAALAGAMAAQGPKILHGSSDITALHVAFGRRLGVTTSFGPMVAAILADREPVSTEHARAALFGAAAPVRGRRALAGGCAEGVLTGGNLALLAALAGTPDAAEPATGRIAFLEDVAEPPYRVDRMLGQLLRAGWFAGVAGIALGTWVDCGTPAELDAVFAARFGPLGVPVLAGLPVGHGAPQLTIELGARARLDADQMFLTSV
ncbi:MAG TPA: LD-carboxypeptidase [Streptosporangiaceae bacterium]|nr:LD-carboxypeptidase [Streptosporangiaceae bacterium]